MQTEKIDKLLEQLIYCDFRTSIGVDKAKKAIRLALKKQDRDTRHACAEAVLKMDEPLDSSAAPSMAHDICMNTRAV